MANDAGTPRKNGKTRRKRRRKKMIMLTGMSSLTRIGMKKKTAKTEDHPAGQLNHVPIQPPPPAAKRNNAAGEGRQEDTGTAKDEAAAAQRTTESPPPGDQEQEQERTAACRRVDEPAPGPGDQEQEQERTAACRRVDDDDDEPPPTCCICGALGGHNEYFCAWNYMDGSVSNTCREGCGPGQHRRRRDACLRRFVRVTNLPSSSFGQRELERLFQPFGPLRVAVITTRLAPPGSAGFGYVAFQEREHAEEAVDKLNGHLVGDRRLRVDWAYPRA